MAARSVKVNLINNSPTDFYHDSDGLEHGDWITYSEDGAFFMADPVEGNGGTGYFESESDGVMTGTQGWATYTSSFGEKFTVKWDNPYSGGNSYSCSIDPAYKISHKGGGGDNAEVTFTIELA